MATEEQRPVKEKPVLPIVATDVNVVYGPWESSSRPGVKHYTFEMADGRLRCTCEGFKYRQHCKHVDQIQDWNAEEAEFDVSID